MSDYKEQCWKRYMENMKYERYEKEDLVDKIIEMQGEIERLNNIINGLEKWLEDYIKLFGEPDIYEEQTLEDLEEVLDKLQELKGDDKE